MSYMNYSHEGSNYTKCWLCRVYSCVHMCKICLCGRYVYVEDISMRKIYIFKNMLLKINSTKYREFVAKN
jgi:hypothetical protein